MSSYSRQQMESWLKTIDVKADKVLDVGGSQLPIKGRTKSWEVNEYKILDLKEPHELKEEPDIAFDLNKNLSIYKGLNEFWSHFNVAFCLEVSEYWYNPLQALENINRLLAVGGTLYISFHFIYPVHNPVLEDCLRYTEYGSVKLLEKAGFRIKDMKFRTTQGIEIMPFFVSQAMRPSKNYTGHETIGTLIEAIKI